MGDSLSATAVIVVNYGSSKLLERHIAPIAQWADLPNVFIVDNFSDDSERRRVRQFANEHHFGCLELATNAGFGAGANAGAAAAIAAGATTLVILNPDASISQADLQTVVAEVHRQPWALYSPKVLNGNGQVWFDGSVVDLEHGRTMSQAAAQRLGLSATMSWVSGACLVTSTQLWSALQGFDEDYFLYWEDVDMSARAHGIGADVVVVATAVAVHDEGGTQSEGAVDRTTPWTRSEAYYYYNIRNRLLFAARNLEPTQARSWSATAWRSAYQTLLIGGRKKFLRPLMPIRAGYRGVRDGRAFVDGPGVQRMEIAA